MFMLVELVLVCINGSLCFEILPPIRILPHPGECDLPVGLGFDRIEFSLDLVLLIWGEGVIVRPDDPWDYFEAGGVCMSDLLINRLVKRDGPLFRGGDNVKGEGVRVDREVGLGILVGNFDYYLTGRCGKEFQANTTDVRRDCLLSLDGGPKVDY
jgi:hypothetical protein